MCEYVEVWEMQTHLDSAEDNVSFADDAHDY
jgi:hypothetical protein